MGQIDPNDLRDLYNIYMGQIDPTNHGIVCQIMQISRLPSGNMGGADRTKQACNSPERSIYYTVAHDEVSVSSRDIRLTCENHRTGEYC